MTIKRLFLSLTLILTLAGCSTSFVYNNLDWLVHWYIDDYVDLNREQKRQFDDKMAQWLDWHQTSELPQYRAQLQQLRQDVTETNMTELQWLEHFDRARDHWERLRARIVPDLVPLARTLSDDQVASIFDELDANDAKRREKRQEKLDEMNQQELFEARYEEVVEDLEQWTGELSDAQIDLVKTYQSRHRSTFSLWMDYRQRWREKVRSVLLERHNPGFEQQLIDALTKVEAFQGEQLPALREANRQHYATLLTQLLPTLDDRQRRHAQREIGELMGDIQSMQDD